MTKRLLRPAALAAAAAAILAFATMQQAVAHDCSGKVCKPEADGNAGLEQDANVTRWNWLVGTYWIVPKSNLPALLFDAYTEQVLPTSDQTVYHITGYRDGYFWGKNVAQLGFRLPGSSPVSCSSLVGAITPQGRILLSFVFVDDDGATVSQQQGFGEMIDKRGQWTMQNLTSTPLACRLAEWGRRSPRPLWIIRYVLQPTDFAANEA